MGDKLSIITLIAIIGCALVMTLTAIWTGDARWFLSGVAIAFLGALAVALIFTYIDLTEDEDD